MRRIFILLILLVSPAIAGTINVTDPAFGAVGDMRTCADMQMTSGSAVLYSPSQCAFTSGDVGKWVQVPQAGDAYGTALSAQISGYTDAEHVTLSVMAGATVTAAVVTYSDLLIASPNTGLSSVGNTFTPDQVGLTLTIAGGTGFTPGTYTITGVGTYEPNSGIATLSAAAGTSGSSSGTGTLALPGTIGTGNYAALSLVPTYACSNPNTTVNWPAGSYYIEKYKILGGASANGVTDITWVGCTGTINTGYGASVVSNGAYRQLNDASGYSYEQTVSPFSINGATGFTIEGLEINGSIENTTKASVYEGQSYGIETGCGGGGCQPSSNITLKDLNVHGFPADSIILALNYVDTGDTISNVFVHNSGRQGLTVANVTGLTATNFQCSMIGITGPYGGHPPEDCIDIEPAIAPAASGIVFSGGYLANAVGALTDTSPGSAHDLTISGMTLDCSQTGVTIQVVCGNGGIGSATAATTVFSENTYYTGPSAQFQCGGNNPTVGWLSSTIENNTFVMSAVPQLSCADFQATILPIYFIGNAVTVTGIVTPENGQIHFDYAQLVKGNTFFLSKNAQYEAAAINYTGAAIVRSNTYSTDLTNAGNPYSVVYTSVNLACGEISLEPTYFLVTGGTSPCPPSSGQGGGASFAGGASIH